MSGHFVKKNVLVFPCGTEVGLEIYRSLAYSTHFNVIGASSVDDHGKYVYENYIGDLPYVDSPEFLRALGKVVEEKQIEFIFPAHDSVVLKLAEAADAGSIRAKVITSPLKTCQIARSKSKTYQQLSDIVVVPKRYESALDIQPADFPVFLKPDVGQGGKGTHIAKSQDDIAFYCQQDPTLILLENLSGKEYTVDCFTNRNGELLFAEGRERRRIQNGISVDSETTNDPRFSELADKINKNLNFRGVWFFQVKENAAGDLVLMEVAPRVAGTMGLTRCRGVNLPLLSLFDAIDMDVSIFENKYQMTIDRALENTYRHDLTYSHVYLDFDDLVVLDNKVNASVVAFIYQCHNKGVKVNLITKHRQDLEESLKNYRLSNIFDSIIWLKEGEKKVDFITEKESIFIDDSFAERQTVSEKHNIPVFDAHMIESLMEK